MEKRRALVVALLCASFALGAAVALIAQVRGSMDDTPRYRLAPGVADDLTVEQSASIERVLQHARRAHEGNVVARVRLDPFEARRALQEMIDKADDRDVVAFYRVVADIKEQRDTARDRIESLRRRMDAARNTSRERPPA